MSTLYPTKTRLALLRQVAGGTVYGCPDATSWAAGRRVTAQMVEMERAGWVHVDQADWTTFWQLTDAGRAVLDANGGAS